MFQQTHQTARGHILLIAQMDDQHLLNTMGMFISWAERAAQQLHDIVAQAEQGDQWGTNGKIMAEVQRKVYGLPKPLSLEEAIEQYGEAVNTLSGRLEPYLLEAWTRELSEADQAILDTLQARWRKAVGRSAALPGAARALLTGPVVLDQHNGNGDEIPF